MNTKRAVSMGDFNYKAPQIFFIDDDDKQQLLRTSVESHYILRPMTTTPMMTYWSRPTRYGHYGIEKYGPNHLLLSAAVPPHYRSLAGNEIPKRVPRWPAMNDARKDLHRSFRLHRNVSWRRICPELSLSFVKCPSPTSSVVVVVVVLLLRLATSYNTPGDDNIMIGIVCSSVRLSGLVLCIVWGRQAGWTGEVLA